MDHKGSSSPDNILGSHARTNMFMTNPIFNNMHTKHGLLRYLNRLQTRHLSLTQSRISLGSWTTKPNATSEMIPMSGREVDQPSPFAPLSVVIYYLPSRHWSDGLRIMDRQALSIHFAFYIYVSRMTSCAPWPCKSHTGPKTANLPFSLSVGVWIAGVKVSICVLVAFGHSFSLFWQSHFAKFWYHLIVSVFLSVMYRTEKFSIFWWAIGK